MKFAGSLSAAERGKAWYELVGVPFDGNAGLKGARFGPAAIRSASQRLETFLWDRKLELSDLLFFDRGDVALDQYRKGRNDRFPERELAGRTIFMGGDHSISYPLVKQLFEHGELGNVIVIDAHADFRDAYRSNRYSNASVMRRIAELVGFENVVEIGIRSASEEEYRAVHDRITVYDAAMVKGNGVNELMQELGTNEEPEKTYLSIDIDVLDPGSAPGVEHPEPGGMTLAELLALIRMISERIDIVASDVVEVNPRRDSTNGITSLHAARVIFELLACYGAREKRY
ncbi:MAG: agmatinase family protein [Candidatus Methanospirareceae archaeon]